MSRKLSSQAFIAAGICLVAIHMSLAWLLRTPGVLTDGDVTRYLLLSRSLLSLHYRDIWVAGSAPDVHFPPGYPALLAGWRWLVGDSFSRLVWLNIAASAGALAFLASAVARLWSRRFALICLAALALSFTLSRRSGDLNSEPSFMLLVMIALWALSREHESPRMAVVAGVSAVAAAMTRSLGIALVAAIAVHWLLQRRFTATLALVAATGATFGTWLWWTMTTPISTGAPDGPYTAQLGAIGTHGEAFSVGTLVLRQASLWRRAFAVALPDQLNFPTFPGTPIDNVVGAILATGLLLFGIVLLYRRWRPAGLFCFFYFVPLTVWPWFGNRFFTPMLPLLVPATLLAAGQIGGLRSPGTRRVAVAALAILFSVVGLARSVGHMDDRVGCGASLLEGPDACLTRDQESFFAALRYIRNRLPADAVILNAKGESLYYYTGRKSPLHFSAAMRLSAKRFIPALAANGAEYVLLGSLHAEETNRLIARLDANCEMLVTEAFFPPRTYLLRLASKSGHGTKANGKKAGTGNKAHSACADLKRYRLANVKRDFARDP